MRDAEPWQVTLFLFQFKEFVQKNFSFAKRDESLNTIARLGITIPQAKKEILGLTYEDYYRGPIPDTDSKKGGEYWEFGKVIYGQEIFIKLKTVSEYGVAICFSFHVPDETIEYPYKKRGKEK
jgi:hypothetical protein